jgi:hypothetical protein
MGLFGKKKKETSYSSELMHLEGLPLAQETPCSLTLNPEELVMTSGNSEFRLSISQIDVVDFKTDIEIAHITQSSLAKGVAGGLMFGPVGAIIGSRPTSKEKRTVTGYMIINYINANGDLAPLLFRGIAPLSAAKFVDKLRPLITAKPKRTHNL